MRILVSGASGLLGSNLALEAASQHTVFGITHHHSLHTTAFSVQQTDLLNPGSLENLLDNIQPDWVIHCAAQANVDACEKDPNLAYQLNVELPQRLAASVGRSGARLLHVSTDAVFDGVRGNYSESDTPNPLSVYARTKWLAEERVLEANPAALVVRVNLFGWSTTGKRSLAEFFYNNLLQGHSVNGFQDVYFCPLLVTDLAQLFLSMLEKRLSGLYHAFSRTSASKYEFGLAVARRFNLDASLISPVSISQASLAAVRSPNLTMRTDKLAQALGLPLPSWQEGLEKLYLQHQVGYAARLRSLISVAPGN